MLGWSAVDIPMLALLPALLTASGFFSGSETALFGLTEIQRMSLRRHRPLAARAVDALLLDQRMLLITVLMGNMTVNVLYFVITSVLLMKTEAGLVGGILLAGGFLVLLIMLGEVTPKLVANSLRERFAAVTAPFLLTFHTLNGPVRLVLDRVVVSPLSRLTAPSTAPPRLDREELAALVSASGHEGLIDLDEQRLLHDVITLSQRRVRDVMTPRVRVEAVPAGATRRDVVELTRRRRFRRLPVYERDLDSIVGMLQVRRYLQAPPQALLSEFTTPPRFVPAVASLDQLLNHFRETETDVAIVVDEYGGTAGIVALEDVVEEIVGDIAGPQQRRPPTPELIGPGRWRVGGDTAIHEWAEAFGLRSVAGHVSTLGGLVITGLGRAPQPGDAVELGNVRLEVEQVDRWRVVSVTVTLVEPGDGPTEGGG